MLKINPSYLLEMITRHTVGLAYYVVDHDMVTVAAGGETLYRFGYTPDSVIGFPLREVLGKSTAAQLEPFYRSALANSPTSTSIRFGSSTFDIQFVPIKQKNRTVAALAVCQDVTTTKELERVNAQITNSTLLDSDFAKNIIELVRQARDNADQFLKQASVKNLDRLTYREGEVLACMTVGQDNIAISRTLNISPNTVKRHISNILKKLEVDSRTAAVLLALKNLNDPSVS